MEKWIPEKEAWRVSGLASRKTFNDIARKFCQRHKNGVAYAYRPEEIEAICRVYKKAKRAGKKRVSWEHYRLAIGAARVLAEAKPKPTFPKNRAPKNGHDSFVETGTMYIVVLNSAVLIMTTDVDEAIETYIDAMQNGLAVLVLYKATPVKLRFSASLET